MMVALGSALGGMARHGVRDLLAVAGLEPQLISTLAVNVAGSLIIGALAVLTAENARFAIHERYRQFLMAGFCGGFTTFSIFSAEAVSLLQAGQTAQAAGYVLATVLLSIAACWTGWVFAGRYNAIR